MAVQLFYEQKKKKKQNTYKLKQMHKRTPFLENWLFGYCYQIDSYATKFSYWAYSICM